MRPSPLFLALTLLLAAATAVATLLFAAGPDVVIGLWALLAIAGLADAALSTMRRHLSAEAEAPDHGFVGHKARFTARLSTRDGRPLPEGLEARLDVDAALGDGRLAPPTLSADGKTAAFTADLPLKRRGEHALRGLSLKWRSRFGLFEMLLDEPLARKIAVAPDITPALSGEIRTQMAPLSSGLKDMRIRGEGSEFHQLREFVPGMDPRGVDWKRSARARMLVSRETRAERNHQIILCIDSGRLMGEEIDGLPKLDRAINAALALAWAGALGGDLVGLYNFDSQPRLFTPPASGRTAFSRIQGLCGQIRYAPNETNHTLGLSHLHGRLTRRSLIIVLSDFADPITAELMVENMGLLMRRHLALFAALRDPALEALANPPVADLDTAARAAAAARRLRERRAVLDRISRLGALCLDSTPEAFTGALVSRYIDIKSRELL